MRSKNSSKGATKFNFGWKLTNVSYNIPEGLREFMISGRILFEL
jgi:hypothetical protein